MAVEDNFEGRGINRIICASEKKNTLYAKLKARLSEGKQTSCADKMDLRGSIEMGKPEAGMASYLVVGYVLLEDDEKRAFDQAEVVKSRPVVLAVTDVIENAETSTQLKYYALLQPTNGVCVPSKIKLDNIYIFWEFRDLETSVRKRKSTWTHLVFQAALKPEALPDMTQRQSGFKKSKASARITLEPSISLSNHLSLLLSTFSGSKNDRQLLMDCIAAIKDSDEEYRHHPSPESRGLTVFCYKSKDITVEEAKSVVIEVKEHWPEVKGLTWEIVRRLKRGMLDSGIELPYHFLNGERAEDDNEDEDEDEDEDESIKHHLSVEDRKLVEAVTEIVSLIERTFPSPVSTTSVLTKRDKPIIAGILKKFKEIRNILGEGGKQILSNIGSSVLEKHSLHEIWTNYSKSNNIDTSKLAFMAALQCVAMAVQNNRGVEFMMDELIMMVETRLRKI
ncbi:hypothetical protein DSL72_008897 [Monilinia vaccinii-corymbosi]|uniref:Uncharacterized protein n=1 Tax=Monilinia vaccinii-corymbosi TaxID=61207 RepID=A0A8A3PQN1_9HELO|nr:hypothetical protein DSL72_008897 [Monilinia vaccinii-corymbosi]